MSTFAVWTIHVGFNLADLIDDIWWWKEKEWQIWGLYKKKNPWWRLEICICRSKHGPLCLLLHHEFACYIVPNFLIKPRSQITHVILFIIQILHLLLNSPFRVHTHKVHILSLRIKLHWYEQMIMNVGFHIG